MREIKFRLIKDGKIVGYERYVHCDQREGYIKGKSLVPQHSKDGVRWDYIYSWEMKTRPKGYWFEAQLDMDVYIEHDDKEQSVGLKDKHGQEIYEGDILSPNNRVVKFGEFKSNVQQGLGFFTRVNEKEWPWSFCSIQAEVSEIIGSIHDKEQSNGD